MKNNAIKLPDYIITEFFEKCPFCGEVPNVFQVPDKRYGKEALSWVVECKNMGCIFRRSSGNQSLKNLTNDWNKRKVGV